MNGWPYLPIQTHACTRPHMHIIIEKKTVNKIYTILATEQNNNNNKKNPSIFPPSSRRFEDEYLCNILCGPTHSWAKKSPRSSHNNVTGFPAPSEECQSKENYILASSAPWSLYTQSCVLFISILGFTLSGYGYWDFFE